MPTITETPVTAYAHCVNSRCPGNSQQEVEAIRAEDSFTYAEQGGDLPGTERSFVRLRFVNDAEAPCPNCGRIRDLSDSPRKQYDGSLSGHDPKGLLDVDPFDAGKQHELRSGNSEALETENRELRDRLATLEGMMAAFMSQPPETEQ
jgi:hypothetical protein